MPEGTQETKVSAGARICDRAGNPAADSCASQGKLLGKLYGSKPGRVMLKVLTKPAVSKLAGLALDHPLSTVAIPPFVLKKHIKMDEFADAPYKSFNAFFTRPVKPASRPIDMSRSAHQPVRFQTDGCADYRKYALYRQGYGVFACGVCGLQEARKAV